MGQGEKGSEEGEGKDGEGYSPPQKKNIPGAATADMHTHFVNPVSAPGVGERGCSLDTPLSHMGYRVEFDAVGQAARAVVEHK